MTLSESDRQFIRTAMSAAEGSYDPHRQVGAAIVGADGELASIGTNRPPAELKCTIEESHAAIKRDPRWKYFVLEHAERNAIRNACHAGKKLEGGTIYLTLFPCSDCARAIVASGLKCVVVPESGKDSTRDEKWLEHYKYASLILDMADINRVNYDISSVE
ncbi:hypothetical protein LB572_06280 [Mesorhizobium sp. BH1-1-5]|uniref:deoxycytidylate deaminase n=1 Tax=Mesorhizobium sp. BH1-1-5 TaxID=2876661 RepID=UPI001CCCE59D|nr:deaminase [Mesorhizobium sp. BH1-1-5]MBZ9986702.1 hypothetical protein [Mesorhizobium sp. BH1-1-5]